MNKEELKDWAILVFWSAYTGLVKTPVATKYGAGGRGEAIKKILTLNPSSELRKRLIDAIAAQMKHRRDLFNKCGSMQKYLQETDRIQFYCNRQGKKWVSDMGWEDEIPSLTEAAEVKKKYDEHAVKCINPGCDKNAIGGRISICQDCECKTHDVYREEKRAYLRKTELTKSQDESMHEYAMRCKERAFKLLKRSI